MSVKKGLGKGLSALITEQPSVEDKKGVEEIDIQLLAPNPDQPRKVFEEEALIELSSSIKEHGIIQPLIVKKTENAYEIIAGERRFRAAKIAGLEKVPVIVKEYSTQKAFQISLIENLQREDLNPIEEANSYKKLQEEFGMSQELIAQKVGKSRPVITNSLRLLQLDARVQNFILENRLTNGHARCLLSLEDKNLQFEIAEKIIEEELTVRESEALVKKINNINNAVQSEENEKQNEVIDSSLQNIEGRLKEILGTKVHIQTKKKNRGKIEIEYYSLEDLDRIYHMLKTIR